MIKKLNSLKTTMLTLAVIGLFTSCNNDDDNNITDNILPTPSNLTISDTSFYPEDITITIT